MRVGDLIENSRGPVVGTLALCDNAVWGLQADDERATNAPITVADRVEAERVPGILQSAAAIKGQMLVFEQHGSATRHHLLDLRSHHVPDLGPEFSTSSAERRGVQAPGVETRPVGVIVQLDELGPPPEEHRLRGAEDDINGRAQLWRPAGDRPERRGRPIVDAAQRAHLTGTGKEHRGGFVRGGGHHEDGGDDGTLTGHPCPLRLA